VLIFRYLAKEVFQTLVALTSILVLIFISNEFVLLLNRAANGKIPGMILIKLMMYELPVLMGALLPLGFYVSLLIVYGRLYVESEMVVLQASGYGANQLLKHSLLMASVVALFLAGSVFWISPIATQERNKLLSASGAQVLIQTIFPGRFQALSGGSQVFYIESMNRKHDEATHIFWAKQTVKENRPQWDILWAEHGVTRADKKTGENYVVLQKGQEYQGEPGESTYQIATFDTYEARLPHPARVFAEKVNGMKTSQLLPFFNSDPQKEAELQWRASLVVMVFTLTLIAVPLSRVSPRSGKFAKLFPAICIFFIYANGMFIARNWLSDDKIPAFLGIWWLHALAALLGLILIFNSRNKLT
jgi:lipopolysaccharide export system permease protein